MSDSTANRLPTNVRPKHYDLTVVTDLVNSTFYGTVKVKLDVQEQTSQIIFHTKDLELYQLVVYSDVLGIGQTAASTSFDTKTERAIVTLSTALPASSKAVLDVRFTAGLTDSLIGYYRSVGGTDAKDICSITQFEPTSARQALPCWDEPLLKATFAVTLISRADTVNLSNMPIVSEVGYATGLDAWLDGRLANSNDQWKMTRFETTPPVAQVSFASLLNFDSFADVYIFVGVREWSFCVSGKLLHESSERENPTAAFAGFALDVKRQALVLYEQVFQIEYPLPKLDTLVVSDFDANAMENWARSPSESGLITGRNSAFLLDPKAESLNVKRQIATTVTHEVAHMWLVLFSDTVLFGNITTMEWWDNLYLNEGFATLMAKVTILGEEQYQI
ncbi:uncharacterized protein FIBRA_06528 [Fibroporia radiculosa]|uniref:Uncharacterized protein n=1 Tax=Fibroporia radiculosa TaxID=599839 RepID=J4IBB2_9APHY|nr:uncharacterized protein FIBRA_06528 [Fibroporia radiculosa]CCM04356.1 predicted protein [Fibroporia radiculosa]